MIGHRSRESRLALRRIDRSRRARTRLCIATAFVALNLSVTGGSSSAPAAANRSSIDGTVSSSRVPNGARHVHVAGAVATDGDSSAARVISPSARAKRQSVLFAKVPAARVPNASLLHPEITAEDALTQDLGTVFGQQTRDGGFGGDELLAVQDCEAGRPRRAGANDAAPRALSPQNGVVGVHMGNGSIAESG